MSDFKAKIHKIRFRLRFRQDPAGRGYRAPPVALAAFRIGEGREKN